MERQTQTMRKISPATGAVLALLGLATSGGLDLGRCALNRLLGTPVKGAIEALPSILLAAWHISRPCPLFHPRFLDILLQIFVSWCQCVLILAGMA